MAQGAAWEQRLLGSDPDSQLPSCAELMVQVFALGAKRKPQTVLLKGGS